jgi:hypothetical protein
MHDKRENRGREILNVEALLPGLGPKAYELPEGAMGEAPEIQLETIGGERMERILHILSGMRLIAPDKESDDAQVLIEGDLEIQVGLNFIDGMSEIALRVYPKGSSGDRMFDATVLPLELRSVSSMNVIREDQNGIVYFVNLIPLDTYVLTRRGQG